jgi:hypothetical protein
MCDFADTRVVYFSAALFPPYINSNVILIAHPTVSEKHASQPSTSNDF